MRCGGRHRERFCGLVQLHGVHNVNHDGALLLGNLDAMDVQMGWSAKKLRKEIVWLGSEVMTSTFETKSCICEVLNPSSSMISGP
jgi:hypothetical protein